MGTGSDSVDILIGGMGEDCDRVDAARRVAESRADGYVWGTSAYQGGSAAAGGCIRARGIFAGM